MKPLVQLALDFFAPPAPPAPEPAPPATAVATVRFAHPQANRQARLGPAIVDYAFRRAKRRTIGFVVGADGLVVSAPRWVPLAEVDAAVRDKSGWILRKLGEAQTRQQRMAEARIVWQDGAVLPFLGQSIRLELDPRHRFAGSGGAALDAERGVLQLALAGNAAPEQIRDTVQAWLMRQAKRLFTERLQHYAPQLGVQWTRLTLSSAGTRWGSASSSGAIRLNWRLIHLRLPIIDYVVVHELSHLRVMDHSPRFWDTVASIVPDYAALRGQLKDEPIPQWP
ncbi:M48 family metallopeptidase [Pseudorhodoferax sp.]|uniref:M48 family metallopeptidase n=1 Tax=Pseudorhodoferax sp. TaxID=1993553 RepID=UPI002DD6A9F1|nr:SprT family zinc-dependent metalloprotease [Pseudorhodoferax sp.]